MAEWTSGKPEVGQTVGDYVITSVAPIITKGSATGKQVEVKIIGWSMGLLMMSRTEPRPRERS